MAFHRLPSQVLSLLLQLMEREKSATGVTSTTFFKRYEEVSLLFVPIDYVARALELVSNGDEPLRQNLLDFLREYADGGGLYADEAACVSYCKGPCADKKLMRRLALVAPRVAGGFVAVDQLLLSLSSRYAKVWEQRKHQVHALFRRYDSNGDGLLSLEEFKTMLKAMSGAQLRAAQVDSMYNTLMSLGDGTIKPEDLQQVLYVLDERTRAEAAHASGLELTDGTIDHDENLARLAHTWESMRNAVSLEADTERWALYNSPAVVTLIIHIQARFRALIVRARNK